MAKKIAITFDDAPMYGGPLLTGEERTQMLLEALAAVGAEATFFATTNDLQVANAIARLNAYNDAGHLIANHTNTHPSASAIPIDYFVSDITFADAILSDFDNYRPWFRFPFLDEGSTVGVRDAYRNELEDLGLSNGYATVDTFDWYLVQRLSDAIAANEFYDLNGIRDAYVDMIVSAANYYDQMGQDYIGRSPVQTLLLHENDLAAMFIDDAILALEADGWEIVSADEAYADPIADIVTDTLQAGSGHLSAIAIDLGADLSILTHESNTTQGLDAMLMEYGAFTEPDAPNLITGTNGDDALSGTSGDDIFEGLEGRDVFSSSNGDDVFYGASAGETAALEYDQVDYSGSLADYVFTRAGPGIVSVIKPDEDTDTLYSVEGFWFSGEQAWYSAAQVLANDPLIYGTEQDDYLIGTGGDDQIFGFAGNDKIEETAGNDVIDGGGTEYDQVDYFGSLSDYVFAPNNDGSVSVTKPNGGVDVVLNIDGFWFGAESAWYSIDQALNDSTNDAIITGTDGDDTLFGAGGNDEIFGLAGNDVINGSLGDDQIDGGGAEYDQVDYIGAESEYIFIQNADGSVTVEKPDGGIDQLTNIDGFWFSDEAAWYSLEQVIDETLVADAQLDPAGLDWVG